MKMYVLKAGENLQRLAAKKNIPLRVLLDANPTLREHDAWPVGTKVHIPQTVLQTSNERVSEAQVFHPFHSYYEHQKRWLEQLHHVQQMYRDCEQRCEPPVHEHEPEHEHERGHEEREERVHDSAPRRRSARKQIKSRLKKRKKKWPKKQREWMHHEPPILDEENERSEQDCHNESSHLPWLNL